LKSHIKQCDIGYANGMSHPTCTVSIQYTPNTFVLAGIKALRDCLLSIAQCDSTNTCFLCVVTIWRAYLQHVMQHFAALGQQVTIALQQQDAAAFDGERLALGWASQKLLCLAPGLQELKAQRPLLCVGGTKSNGKREEADERLCRTEPGHDRFQHRAVHPQDE